MRSVPFLSSAQLLGSFAPFGAPGGIPPPVSHSFLLEALPSVAFSAGLLSSVTHQLGLAAASEVRSRPPRAGQGSGSPTAPSFHGDSALLCRLVWGGTAARWREGLVSYGMCQGDNLSGYNWQERGENGTLARTGNQRVASPTAFRERARFALHPGRLVGSGPALLFILTQPVSLEEWKHLPLRLPGSSALSGEQLPDTVSSQVSVGAHCPRAAFLRPTDRGESAAGARRLKLRPGSPFSGLENGYWSLCPGFLFPLSPRMLLSLLLTSPLYGSPGLSKSLCV